MIWHICNSKHSKYIKVLICRNDLLYTSSIIHDSLVRLFHRCDVRDVMQPLAPSLPHIIHHHNIVNPPPPRCMTPFMDDPLMLGFVVPGYVVQFCSEILSYLLGLTETSVELSKILQSNFCIISFCSRSYVDIFFTHELPCESCSYRKLRFQLQILVGFWLKYTVYSKSLVDSFSQPHAIPCTFFLCQYHPPCTSRSDFSIAYLAILLPSYVLCIVYDRCFWWTYVYVFCY